MSGNLDYAQFEEEARSLYKIHAYISYTLDKLILTIVRQVQHILGDDLCKDCTGLFLQHTKVLSTGGHSSCFEASQVEYEYFWKAEKLLEDEDKVFKIVWHKEKHILTVEIHEHENNREYPDPHEAEMKSNYIDTYIREDFCYEDFLDAVEQLPVILPRNLKKQQIYWKNKVTEIKKLWLKRENSKCLKKAPKPSLKRRKAFCFKSPVLRKRPRTSSAQENNMSLSWKGAASKYNYEPNLNVGTFKTMHEGEQKIGLKVMSDVKIKKKVSGDKTGISTKNVSGKSGFKIPEPQNISIHVEEEKNENKKEECKEKKNDNETFIEIEKKTLEDKEEMKDNVKKAIDKVNKLESSSESLSKESEKMIVDNVAEHLKEFGEAKIINLTNPLKESGKEKIDNSADHFKEMNKTTKEIDNLVEQSEDSKRKVEDTEIEEEETKDETGNLIYDPKNETSSKRLKTDAVKKSQDFNEVAIEDVRVETTKMLEEIITADSYSSATESEHKSDDINISKKVISGEMKKKRALSPEDVSDPKDVEIDLKSRVDMAIEMAHRVMETINSVDQKERNVISDSDSVGKTEELIAKVSDEGPSKRRNTRSSKDYSVVRRKQINQYSVKRRAKRTVQCNKGKRRRQTKPKCEYLDDPTFDFFHLSALPSDEKNEYLALKHVTIDDNEHVYFKRGGYKITFIQNHHYYMYRKNTLHRAKEIHQAASEIKTSNFIAWHMAWLDEHVTPTMLKSCNDWLVKNEKDKFTSERVTVSDCTKPPYIPYNKYKVYYYEAEDEEELGEG
ncbi:paired amphipathic helix protein Sin3a [Caerostris extrusa]|uniref:Paired amphipathic helix protein Sin3a n=1 Tax=Caerostris extrusa TaxID=172846 RepID=A0AAV4XK59_CAEEX|nr:paired amphipathic helix protein Sin3a [Caerostris extrusa]